MPEQPTDKQAKAIYLSLYGAREGLAVPECQMKKPGGAKCGAPATIRACLTTSQNAERRESHPEGTFICDDCLAEFNAFLQFDLPGASVRLVREEKPDA